MDNLSTKSGTFKSRWEDFYSNYTMHGVRFVFETTGVRRLFWFVLVCSSFTLSIFLFEGSINDYLLYKTVTFREEVFGVDVVEFPSVTICNLNSVSRRKVKALGIPEHEIMDLYRGMKSKKMDMKNNKTMNILEEFFKNNITTPMDFTKLFELDLDDLMEDPVVISLSEGKPCMFNEGSCTTSDFAQIISPIHGLCAQFNSHFLHQDILQVKKAGEGYGLKMYMNIHEDDLMISRVPYQGLAVFVHPFGTPFNSARSQMVPVQPGTMSFIHVKLSQLELLKAPYKSDCVDTQQYHIVNSTHYSRPMCKKDCVMKKVHDMCGCFPMHFAQYAEAGGLCSFDKMDCEFDFQVNETAYETVCGQGCPIECNYTKYEVYSDQTSLGTKMSIREIEKLPGWNLSTFDTMTFVSRNLVGLDISFTDISYQKETISPSVTWSSLLGSVGGNIGLCLGASLITFTEFFVFCFDMAVKWAVRMRGRK